MQIEGKLKCGVCVNLLGLVVGLLVTIVSQVGAQRSTRWAEGSLRLVGGRSKNEGTVLIYHWSRWGAICDDYWDVRDANVVCNELGFAGAKEAHTRSKFGKGRRRVWLSGLHCRGNERHVTMCYSRGWGNQVGRCKGYWSSAGVVCNGKTTTTTSTTTTTTSRPITTAAAETTTTPTPRATTTTVPTTKRPTTTTTTTVPTTKRPTTTTSTTHTPTTTVKTTSKPTTTSKRTTITPAHEYRQWIYNKEEWKYYMYFRDGSYITSSPDSRYTRRKTTTTTTTTSTTTPRPSPVNYNQIYNAIGGDNNIDTYAPQQIRQRTENTRTRHEHHHNRNQVNHKEGYVQDQPAVELEDPDFDNLFETEQAETQVVEPKQRAPDYTEFRLLGGRKYTGYREGRVEVRLAHSFTWGVVCGDNWALKAAIVTCKHFNAGYARQAHKTDFYGGSDMDKVVATLRCTGREERLEDCTVEETENKPGKEACSRPNSVAGVICESRLPDLEPDLHAIEESVFLRDSYLYYLQCAYEENCLSSSATDFYGTGAWRYAKRRLLHFSTIAKNIGTADFRPDSNRDQWEWHACHQHYHSMASFSHYDIIDKHGNQIAEGHKASFCLEDSRCERGVQPKYNCQEFGSQGISAGCQDNYLADIDCQWIDVTDVHPGIYTLKVELNPNMNVPEISYDNNVARCQLAFSTRYARVNNCTLDTLL